VSNFDIKVAGLEKLADKLLKLERPTFKALKNYIKSASETVAGTARQKTPVNNGNLRGSINVQMDENPSLPYVEASIGTNVNYAPYMEYGTGLVHDHPNWPRKVHKVSYKALLPWATRKVGDGPRAIGFAIAVAKNIMKRGGLLPRRFLRGSLESFIPRVKADTEKIISAIKREAEL